MNNFLNPTLSRRNFLGLAGASLAMTVAESSMANALSRAPLAVNIALSEADALDGLGQALSNPDLDVCTVLIDNSRIGAPRAMASKTLSALVRDAIHHAGSKVRVADLKSNGTTDLVASSAELPLLLLGSFPGLSGSSKETAALPLMRLLLASRGVYVDEPQLAAETMKRYKQKTISRKIIPGYCSAVDPAVQFALQHLHSDAFGRVKLISVSVRPSDSRNLYEAKAIYARMVTDQTNHTLPACRLMAVPRVRPALTLYGCQGHLQVGLYSERDRREMLPLRLKHFASALS